MIGTIYKITSPTNKIYIGQSWNFKHRVYVYKSKKAKGQPKLHASILKYGFENHKFEILIQEECNQEILDNYEIYYIKQYNTLISGLNVKHGGSSGKHSNETKQKLKNIAKNRTPEEKFKKSLKLSQIHKGKSISKEHKEKLSKLYTGKNNKSAKKVTQFSKTGDFIKNWDYIKAAVDFIEKTSISNIVKCCKGKIKSSGGYIWKYTD